MGLFSRTRSKTPPPAKEGARAETKVHVTRPAVVECLRYVIDPEVGVNIVDLGLICDLQVELPRISVEITMTTPACPMSGQILQQVRGTLERVKGAEEVEVDLVWEPAWSAEMMDPDVRERRFGGRFAPRHS